MKILFLKCINNINNEGIKCNITVGKYYIAFYPFNGPLIQVIGNNGIFADLGFPKKCFNI